MNQWFLVVFFILVSSSVFAQERKLPVAVTAINPMPIVFNGGSSCTTSAAVELSQIVRREQICFSLDDANKACKCLNDNSYMYRLNRTSYMSARDSKNSTLPGVGLADEYSALKDVQLGVEVGAIADEKLAQDFVDYYEETKNQAKGFFGRVISPGKDAESNMSIDMSKASSGYKKYLKEQDDCISFADFSLIKSLPQKDFVGVLNSPDLKVEDFLLGRSAASDKATQDRRHIIKEFMSFNPAWEAIFIAGDSSERKLALAKMKEIYGALDSQKLKQMGAFGKEGEAIISGLNSQKNAFFKSQHRLADGIKKASKTKTKDFTESVEFLAKHSAEIEGNPVLIYKIIRYKNLPTIQECRENPAMLSRCLGTYSNFCSQASENKLSDKMYAKAADAFEKVEDNQFVFNSYQEVTAKYCDRQFLLNQNKVTWKGEGEAPKSLDYPTFKKLYCEEKVISLKQAEGSRESLCNKNQKLLGYFTSEVIETNLVAQVDDEDNQFLRAYTSETVHADESVKEAAMNLALSSSSEKKGFAKLYMDATDKFRKEILNSSSGGGAEIVQEKKSIVTPSIASTALSAISKVTNEEVEKTNTPLVQPIMAPAYLAPEVAHSYALPQTVSATQPEAELNIYKAVADSQISALNKEINLLRDSEKKREMAGLEKELAQLKDYSKSIGKMIEDKNDDVIPSPEAVTASRQIASVNENTVHYPVAGALVPSKVYEDHFTDAGFHQQASLGQSAQINRQIQGSSKQDEMMNAIYGNSMVKSIFETGEATSSGNMVLMTSPIELTESNESKLSKREVQVDQILLDEIKLNPERVKKFFEEKKIEHVGLLTLRTSQNIEVNYMMRKDEKGKLLVIPVNIARKSKLDDLRRTFQVKAF